MSAEFEPGTWGIGIVGSIIAGMTGAFFVQKIFNYFDKKGIENNVKDVIKEELTENLKRLNAENLTTIKKDERSITFSETMEIYSFESAVKSGNYILLNKDLRKEISEVYASMELANNLSDDIAKLTFTVMTTDLERANFDKIFENQKQSFIDSHNELKPKLKSLIENLN